MKPISDKRRKGMEEWQAIVRQRVAYLMRKYGCPICEWSGEEGILYAGHHDDLNGLDGHHIDGNRRNNTWENCYIVKRKYHALFKQNHTKVKQEGFQGKINSPPRAGGMKVS